MNEHLRQTGRTTRLIERAVREAHVGRAVYILVAEGSHAKLLMKKVDELWQKLYPGRGGHGIVVEGPMARFDWSQMTLPGAHPNCVFLVDHSLAERRIEEIQKEIRYLTRLVVALYPITT